MTLQKNAVHRQSKHARIVSEWREQCSANKRNGQTTLDAAELRVRIDDQLNRLSADLMNRMNVDADQGKSDFMSDARATAENTTLLQKRIALLGQLAAGLRMVESHTIPVAAAGYGSTVVSEELFLVDATSIH